MEENLVKIYEVEDYKKTNEPIWLEQMLIDNNIPYSNELEEYWIGIRFAKHKIKLKIYVQEKYERIVKKYIEDFQNQKSIIKENIKELKDINDDENDIEVKRYSKIRKIGYILYIVFLLVVIIFGIIVTIMTNI